MAQKLGETTDQEIEQMRGRKKEIRGSVHGDLTSG
jgi:hypothetical protein